MKLLSTVSTLLSTSLLTRACADDCYEPTKAPLLGMPGFEFLYTVNASLAPAIVVGAAPLANRTIYPITGGRFEGPKMKGSIPLY